MASISPSSAVGPVAQQVVLPAVPFAPVDAGAGEDAGAGAVVAVNETEGKIYARNYQCVYCMNIVWNAVQSRKCKHFGCASCIKASVAHASQNGNRTVKCPSCRVPHEMSDYVPMSGTEPQFIKVLGDLTIHCPWYYREEDGKGCQWQGLYSEAQSHLAKTCLFATVTCDFCQKVLSKTAIVEHEKGCKWWETCGHCGTKHANTDKQTHLQMCAKFPKPCPNAAHGCRATGTPQELQEHEPFCDGELISCTVGERPGFAHKVRRSQFRQHLEQVEFHALLARVSPDDRDRSPTVNPPDGPISPEIVSIMTELLAMKRDKYDIDHARKHSTKHLTPVTYCPKGHVMRYSVGPLFIADQLAPPLWRANIQISQPVNVWDSGAKNPAWRLAIVQHMDPPKPNPAPTPPTATAPTTTVDVKPDTKQTDVEKKIDMKEKAARGPKKAIASQIDGGGRVYIKFVGFSEQYDEWIHQNSDRIAWVDPVDVANLAPHIAACTPPPPTQSSTTKTATTFPAVAATTTTPAPAATAAVAATTTAAVRAVDTAGASVAPTAGAALLASGGAVASAPASTSVAAISTGVNAVAPVGGFGAASATGAGASGHAIVPGVADAGASAGASAGSVRVVGGAGVDSKGVNLARQIVSVMDVEEMVDWNRVMPHVVALTKEAFKSPLSSEPFRWDCYVCKEKCVGLLGQAPNKYQIGAKEPNFACMVCMTSICINCAMPMALTAPTLPPANPFENYINSPAPPVNGDPHHHHHSSAGGFFTNMLASLATIAAQPASAATAPTGQNHSVESGFFSFLPPQ